MYTKFFGLNEKPFSITPDPRYLFMSERHSEGLAHLVYGVKDSSGFIQLTGEVGTGKTTLVRTLLTRIPDGVEVALVLNPQLSAVEFLEAICEELKIDIPDDRDSAKALVDALNKHLLASHAEDRRTILMIDEAQNLATEVLEQIRLLTNLETSKQKLLQIILIAQPELREKLSQTNLRQLAQRVTGRYHLEPLSREETERYIEHRLKVAGGLGDIFDHRAKREVFRFSGGVPRLTNVICDRALLGAYSQEVRRITPAIVRTAASEVSGEVTRSAASRWLLPAFGLLTLAVVAAGVVAVYDRESPTSSESVSVSLSGDTHDVQSLANNTPTTPDPAESTEAVAPSLDEVLQDLNGAADTTTAMRTLLSLWNVNYSSDAGTACQQAEATGLHCLLQRGSWSNLRQLDRPAVVTLTDSAGSVHRPVLAAIGDDSVDLQVGEVNQTFPANEFADVWYGQFLILWQPPGGDTSMIRRGSRGPKVVWLRNSLAALNALPASDATTLELFDRELELQLIEFQRRNKLQADGLAGHQTQIIINSQLQLDGTPSLTGT
jgi:general secretion pathway protein A